MKSVMHDKKEGTCYLCVCLNGDYSRKQTQEHHVVFGTANRKMSEKYGLKVYLCERHHAEGPAAVHNNAAYARYLQRKAQEAFELTHTREEWMAAFGRSFL